MNFFSLAVKGQKTGSMNDCSSFSVLVYNSSRRLIKYFLDNKNIGERKTQIKIYPSKQIFNLNLNKKNAINCDSWSYFWFSFNENEFRFGLGRIYDENTLFTYYWPGINVFTHLIFKNTISNLISKVKILDKDGRKMSDLINQKCNNHHLYHTIDDDVNTCSILTKSLNFFRYSIKNGFMYLGNISRPLFVFKKMNSFNLSDADKIRIQLMIDIEDKLLMETCKKMIYDERKDFIFQEYFCLNERKLKILNMEILIEIQEKYKNHISLCEFSHNPFDISYF